MKNHLTIDLITNIFAMILVLKQINNYTEIKSIQLIQPYGLQTMWPDVGNKTSYSKLKDYQT